MQCAALIIAVADRSFGTGFLFLRDSHSQVTTIFSCEFLKTSKSNRTRIQSVSFITMVNFGACQMFQIVVSLGSAVR